MHSPGSPGLAGTLEAWHFPPEMEFTHGVDRWRVRDCPDISSRTLVELTPGGRFLVSGREGDWLQVLVPTGPAGFRSSDASEDVEGWVYPKLTRRELPDLEEDLQVLFPVMQGGSTLSTVSPQKSVKSSFTVHGEESERDEQSPQMKRTKSCEQHLNRLLTELHERRTACVAAARDRAHVTAHAQVLLELKVQETMDKLGLLGIEEAEILDLEGEESLANPDDVAASLMSSVRRSISYHHADFSNPRAESCWLSTLFQSLWHSKVFHTAFERLVRPLPRAERGTALGALQETWECYEEAAAKKKLVSVKPLVKACGRGYGDAAEALGKLQGAPDLSPLADIFALVPVPWSGRTPKVEDLWNLVTQMAVTHHPLIALDFVFPPLKSSSMYTLALSLEPTEAERSCSHPATPDVVGDLGDDYRLVAMICYMEEFKHYVVFCRTQSDPSSWMFFNDLPGIASGARRRLHSWRSVARNCGRFGACPKTLIYESDTSAETFFEKEAAKKAKQETARTAGAPRSPTKWGSSSCRQM